MVVPKGAVGAIVPVLIALLSMAIKDKEWEANVGGTILLIKAEPMVGVPNLSHTHYVRLPQTSCNLQKEKL